MNAPRALPVEAPRIQLCDINSAKMNRKSRLVSKEEIIGPMRALGIQTVRINGRR